MRSFEQYDEACKYFAEGVQRDSNANEVQKNASEGITLQIEKKAETAGALNAYIYLIMDAQSNIQSGAYVSAVY